MSSITIGPDLAKNVFQVHGVDAGGCVVFRKKLRRSEVLRFFEDLSPSLVGMEACATAHYWGRTLSALGHQVRLIPPAYLKAYVRRQKNDAADAQAICEAVSRPTMRFVPIKTAERQSVLVLHRSRDLLVRQRTMLINAVRSQCAEFGLGAPQGALRLADLVVQIRCGIGRMRRAIAWPTFPVSGSSPPQLWWLLSPIQPTSARAASSQPSSASCHAKTRRAARSG